MLTMLSSCGGFWFNGSAVEINGVRWASYNVAENGFFDPRPWTGTPYQWNNKEYWRKSNKNPKGGTVWIKENDPSPWGYRVPGREDMLSLLDTTKVRSEWITHESDEEVKRKIHQTFRGRFRSGDNEWITQESGIEGVLFTDKNTGKSVFLSATRRGYFNNLQGLYWTNTPRPGGHPSAYALFFSKVEFIEFEEGEQVITGDGSYSITDGLPNQTQWIMIRPVRGRKIKKQ
jgi:hypothetical protein